MKKFNEYSSFEEKVLLRRVVDNDKIVINRKVPIGWVGESPLGPCTSFAIAIPIFSSKYGNFSTSFLFAKVVSMVGR